MTQPPDTAQVADLLAQAVHHLNGADDARAEACLDRALALDPAEPVAHCLLGIIRLERRDWHGAEESLRRAMAIDPDQPQVLFHLARTLRALARPREAIPLYTAALKHAPGERMLWLELGVAQEEAGAVGDAQATYAALLKRAPGLIEAERRLAVLWQRCGRGAEAEAMLRGVLARIGGSRDDDATRVEVELELASILKTMRRHADALAHLDRAAALAPGNAGIQTQRAVVLQHLRRFDDAIGALRAILAADPLDMATHLQLNDLLYRHERDDAFLASYDEAAAAAPGSTLPHTAKAHLLLKAGRPREAHDHYARALAIAADDPVALVGRGRALEALGDADAATAAYRASLARHPDNLVALVDGASFLLRSGEVAEARTLAERAHALQPASQEALAVLGLCYRAAGDAREYRLNGYDTLIRAFDLEAPRGFRDMAEFNTALATYLDALHGDRREHFSQTLRGGTRLYDDIFNNGHALVDLLRERIDGAVAAYIGALPADAAHPFTARRGSAATYAGSWSSRLFDAGFHVNHLHPGGWISSAYYVAVPDVSSDTGAKQGWLKFGEPGAEFGDAFAPRRFVQPVPGRLVLFPSYVWHGTTPFRSPQKRMTIAFDILPAATG